MFKFLFRIVRWGVLVALVLGVVAWFYPEKFLTVDSGPAAADVIVVIGGGSHERPLRAAQLFQLHAAARVIITGAGDDEINRQILMANGVPARAIEVENQSSTTCENAEFTIQRLRAEPCPQCDPGHVVVSRAPGGEDLRAFRAGTEILFAPGVFRLRAGRLEKAGHQPANAAGIFEAAGLLDPVWRESVLKKLALRRRLWQ